MVIFIKSAKFLKVLFISLIILALLGSSLCCVYAANYGVVEAQNVVNNNDNTIDVPIVVTANPGIVSLKITIEYDSSVLSLISVTDNKLLSGFQSGTDSATLSKVPYYLVWVDYRENNYQCGEVATLKFQFADDVPNGSYDIVISCNEGDAVNQNVQDVQFVTDSGTITRSITKLVFSQNDEKTKATAWFVNSSTRKAYVYLALYDNLGKMIGIASSQINNLTAQTVTFSNVVLYDSINKVKVKKLFMIDTHTNLPLDTAVLFE